MHMRKRQKFSLIAVIAALFVMLSLPVVVMAIQTAQQPGPERKFRTGNDVTIPAGETVTHDLYVFGGNVNVDGRIEGDLIVAGGQVNITGAVTGDVAAAGGNVRISGPVDGDVRAAGGTVEIAGPIKEDLLVGSGTLIVASAGQIGQDLIFGTGQTTLAGTVAGGVMGSTGSYFKTGTVRGSENVQITEREPEVRQEPSALSRILDVVRRFASVALFGGLLLWLAPRLFQGAANFVREQPLPSFGWGIVAALGYFAILFGLFIAMLVLSIPLGILHFGGLVVTTIVGVVLASSLLTFLFLLVGFFIADAVVGFAIGRLVLGMIGQPDLNRPIWALLLGVLIVVLLTAIPVVGVLLHILTFLVGLGGLILIIWRWRRRETEVVVAG
jgi:cytoskeletal protein CcmA (bactofilin family)